VVDQVAITRAPIAKERASGALPLRRRQVIASRDMSYQTCIRSLAAAAITFAPTAGAQNLTTPGIAGVVNAGTPIQIVKEGFDGTEGPLPQADGSLLFTENRAGRVVRVAADGSTSVWLAASGGANALALTPAGEIVATLTEKPSIGMVQVGEAPRVLVDAYEG
jgi:gluconolactonase